MTNAQVNKRQGLTFRSSRTVIVERLVIEQSSEVARFGGLESVQVVDCESERSC